VFSLREIIITQRGLRDQSQILSMVEFVQRGGYFSPQAIKEFCEPKGIYCSPKIFLSRFPDGQIYFHDGHHRSYAIWLGGRDYLDESEYSIKDFRYEDYLEVNLSVGFVTPFDPRKEVRLCNFLEYKSSINEIIRGMKSENVDEDHLKTTIMKISEEKASMYKCQRKHNHICQILQD
jgi:hypothetical protein